MTSQIEFYLTLTIAIQSRSVVEEVLRRTRLGPDGNLASVADLSSWRGARSELLLTKAYLKVAPDYCVACLYRRVFVYFVEIFADKLFCRLELILLAHRPTLKFLSAYLKVFIFFT